MRLVRYFLKKRLKSLQLKRDLINLLVVSMTEDTSRYSKDYLEVIADRSEIYLAQIDSLDRKIAETKKLLGAM